MHLKNCTTGNNEQEYDELLISYLLSDRLSGDELWFNGNK